MQKLILISLVALFVFQSCAKQKVVKEEVSTYYLIRHAEKDRSDASNLNPDLTVAGLQRAENWAIHFKDIKFDEVYSTNYNRTKQTASPTANANDITLHFYNPNTIDIEELLRTTKGKTLLIVGHSDSTPMLTNALLGEDKYEAIADDNNSNLYKVTVSKDSRNATLSVVPTSTRETK